MHEIFPITPRSPASRPPPQAFLPRIHTYESRRDLLTRVENRSNDQTISRYDYTNDPARRRTQMTKSGTMMPQEDTLTYTYNPRSEIITAHAQNDPAYHYDYTFDTIGNRLTATENGTNSVYLANQLNQYTAINDFEPQFDPDGNQTLIQTTTGLWQVTYNGENRPIVWTQGDTRIEMIYDHLGRRVFYTSTTGDTTTRHTHFHYNGYLCLQEIDAPTGTTLAEYTWDLTEPIATRPLQMRTPAASHFYHFDGNKNVTDLATSSGIPAAHYDYAPFGAIIVQTGSLAQTNPYRFSSEYHDDDLTLIFYNYRCYNSRTGRWTGRDPIEEKGGKNLYGMASYFINGFDRLGKEFIWNEREPDFNATDETFRSYGKSGRQDGMYVRDAITAGGKQEAAPEPYAGYCILRDYNYTSGGQIFIRKGLENELAAPHSKRTVLQHEQAHRSNHYATAVIVYSTAEPFYNGTPICCECATAIESYLSFHSLAFHYFADANNAALDWEDSPGDTDESRDSFQNSLLYLNKAMEYYQSLDQKKEEMSKACSKNPKI